MLKIITYGTDMQFTHKTQLKKLLHEIINIEFNKS